MKSREPYFGNLIELCEQFIVSAEQTDSGTIPPREHLHQLAAIGHFRFVTRATSAQRRRALDYLSSACGVTAFLSTQHEGVCRRLVAAEHALSEVAVEGQRWYGVCFAHLRRNPSPVEARIAGKNVTFSGKGPWFTGFEIMDSVLVGGATSEGRLLFGINPVNDSRIKVEKLPPLAVMEATATVALTFHDLEIVCEDIVVNLDRQELEQQDVRSTVYQSARSLGVARGAARFLSGTAHSTALQRIENLHQKMDHWDDEPSAETAAPLRRSALQLADNVLLAAFVEKGGSAHLKGSPLHRLRREASFYSTTQLTKRLRGCVLEPLSDFTPSRS